MSTEQTLALAAVIFLVIGVVFWIAARERKPRPPVGKVELFDEAPIKLENKPWSPTRGIYSFAVRDLPPPYQVLSGVAGNDMVSQLAEDEDDARRQLGAMLAEKHLKETERVEVVPVLAAPLRFKPLVQRKGARAHAR